MVKLITQVVIKGQNIDSLPLKESFQFDKLEKDYALLNIDGREQNYLIDLNNSINKLYEKKDVLSSKLIKSKEVVLLFSYKEQGNIEIPTDIMRKLIDLNVNLSISFYESKQK